MSASKVLAIGIATIALGASGSPGASATQPSTSQEPRPISATATADAVTFVPRAADSRFLIIKMSSQRGEAPQISEVTGEARIPATSSDSFLIYRISSGYLYTKAEISDCKLASCPIPPPCPPPGQCPWAGGLTMMKAKTP